MQKIVRLLAVAVLTASCAACKGVDSPSSYTPDDFSGTLDPGGQANKSFSVSKTGELSATLTALSPAPRVGFISLAIGSPIGSLCSPGVGYTISQAALNQQYSFSTITKGNYCVVVYDANGVLSSQATFTVRLLHP